MSQSNEICTSKTGGNYNFMCTGVRAMQQEPECVQLPRCQCPHHPCSLFSPKSHAQLWDHCESRLPPVVTRWVAVKNPLAKYPSLCTREFAALTIGDMALSFTHFHKTTLNLQVRCLSWQIPRDNEYVTILLRLQSQQTDSCTCSTTPGKTLKPTDHRGAYTHQQSSHHQTRPSQTL